MLSAEAPGAQEFPAPETPPEAAEALAESATAVEEASPAEGDPVAPGLLGKIKGKVVRKVSELESVQKGVQFVVDKSKAVHQKVSESERVQQSVDFVKRKGSEIAESERVQKGVEMATSTAKVVAEKTTQGIEIAKEKTKAVREGAGAVWLKGRGTIERARASVSTLSWKGRAHDTLDMAARQEQWAQIRVQGAEELDIPARTEHTSAYHVARGSTLRWTFRVKDKDIGFGVRMRVQEWGGSREDEVLPVDRYDCGETISGSWVADEDRTIILAFDNRYSKLRSKTVAYIVGTERPAVVMEDPAEQELVSVGPASERHEKAII